jgi:hypothetical protein
MALTQEQRISLSRKFIEIPMILEKSDETIGMIESQKDEVEQLDNTHKSLIQDVNTFIEAYGGEMSYLTGAFRANLTEAHMEDAVNRTLGNFFFPNQPDVSVPSISGNVWKFLNPFSGSIAIGKQYNENYLVVGGEQNTYSSISSLISTIEGSYTNVQRVTGNSCSMDTVSVNATLHAQLSTLTGLVNTYKTALNTEVGFINTQLIIDTNVTNNTNSQANKDNINNVIMPAIDAWLAAPNFDPQTAATCAAFNSINIIPLLDTKLKPSVLNALKAALLTRQSFVTTRVSQVNTLLGSVGQNLSTGDLNNSGSGYYDKRFRLINLRINAVMGSLTKLRGIEKSVEIQEGMKANNEIALDTYGDVLACSGFRSPSVGSNVIHVKDGSIFSNGDTVYVVTDEHPELTGTIVNRAGNALTLSFTVPQKYTVVNFGRVYKTL